MYLDPDGTRFPDAQRQPTEPAPKHPDLTTTERRAPNRRPRVPPPRKNQLTGVQPRVLLHVAELLEPPVAVRALVRLLAGVHPYVLHQLVVAAERLEALLALVRFDLRTTRQLPGDVHLHRRLVHEYLQEEEDGGRSSRTGAGGERGAAGAEGAFPFKGRGFGFFCAPPFLITALRISALTCRFNSSLLK